MKLLSLMVLLKLKQNQVQGLQEKPTYTYYSNAGIYLMKREVLASIHKILFAMRQI